MDARSGPSQHHGRRRLPRRIPRLEALEGRDLPSVTPIIYGLQAPGSGGVPQPSGPTDQAGAMVPTHREAALEQFAAWFQGGFAVGPPRFTNQSRSILVFGGGLSNQFLHGDLQMALYPARDPAQPATGTAALIVKNVTNSGNLLVLDLVGDPAALDRHGRPTRFTWTVDGSSGGQYSGATGQGTARVFYSTGNRAGATFRGTIVTNRVTNVIRPWPFQP